MMGPHWNQNYAEIAIGLHGSAMICTVCPTIPNETLCKNQRFKVKEGDVFVVPRYHPMSHISYNNESFVFVGFTMTSKKNHPRYLAGKSSILKVLGKLMLGKSLNANMTTVDQVYSDKKESLMFECTSCAEEVERLMEEEEAGRGREGRGEGRHGEKREGETTRKEEEERGREGEGEEGRGSQEKEAERTRKEEEEMGREREEERGWGRQEKQREGEIARKEEEEMERRRQEAEEAAARGGGGGEKW